jgi:hypothetical protein
VKGDTTPATQPTYRVRSDAVVNLAIGAANPTNPRIDRVIAEVLDATFTGSQNLWHLRVVAGTPAGSPVAPAEPSTAITLALVSVPANDTTIDNAQITDARPRASLGGQIPSTQLVTALPASPFDGQEVVFQTTAMRALTPPIWWHLRYDANGGSPTSTPWGYMGGSEWQAVGSASAQRTNGAYGAPTSGSVPSITPPLGGAYLLEFGALFGDTTANQLAFMAPFQSGGLAAADGNAVEVGNDGANYERVHRRLPVTGLVAGTALTMQLRSTGGLADAQNPYLAIRPIAVG